VSVSVHLPAFSVWGAMHETTVQPNNYRHCPFVTYPGSPVLVTMTSVAFPKSIFSELAANLPRHACRTGESITMSSNKGMWIGFRSAIPGIAFLLTVTLGGVGTAMAATTHYIAANGSDANNGISTATPWAHAPGMPNCAGNCASYQPAAGDSIIFRGGDTWHFGNSSATPYTGGTWSWNWNGSSTNCDVTSSGGSTSGCIYVGVDQTWFSGGSWSRPIMNADNGLTPNPGVWGDTVASCSYQIGTHNQMLNAGNTDVIFDNFEWTGLCEGTGPSDFKHSMIEDASQTGHNQYSNMYAHGFTHVAFGASSGCNGATTTCFNMFFIHGQGLSHSTIGPYNVCDGSDSDPGGFGCVNATATTVIYNIFRNNAQVIWGSCHNDHDNIVENIYGTGDGSAHGNLWECNSSTSDAIHVFYNNIIRNNTGFAHAGSADTKFDWCSNGTSTYYEFNNVMYNVGAGNYWNTYTGGLCSASPSPQFLFNNTFDSSNTGAAIECNTGLTIVNNHFITNGAITNSTGNGACASVTNNTVQTVSVAEQATQEFFSSVTNTCSNDPNAPCSPISTSATVGAGINETNTYCSALAASSDPAITIAGTACQNATGNGCAYSTSNHTVSCPRNALTPRPGTGAWDNGAWAYNSGDQPPSPPSGLTAVVH
jgi:hypothetical protein